MNQQDRVLLALYEIVKDDPHPLRYHCHTRELLLRLKGQWEPDILEQFVRDELIVVKKGASSLVILLTEKGLSMAKMRSAFANHS